MLSLVVAAAGHLPGWTVGTKQVTTIPFNKFWSRLWQHHTSSFRAGGVDVLGVEK